MTESENKNPWLAALSFRIRNTFPTFFKPMASTQDNMQLAPVTLFIAQPSHTPIVSTLSASPSARSVIHAARPNKNISDKERSEQFAKAAAIFFGLSAGCLISCALFPAAFKFLLPAAGLLFGIGLTCVVMAKVFQPEQTKTPAKTDLFTHRGPSNTRAIETSHDRFVLAHCA